MAADPPSLAAACSRLADPSHGAHTTSLHLTRPLACLLRARSLVQVEFLYPPGTLLQSAKKVRAAFGIQRNSSRGDKLGNSAATAAMLRVVDVVPIMGDM